MTAESPSNWESIVDRHAERVYRIAFRILGSVHDAEDVSQIVFTEAFAIHTRRDIKDDQGWTGLFVRLATLRAIDVLRKRKTMRNATRPVADHDAVSQVGPDDVAIGEELASWLRSSVSQLPEQQGAVFSLSAFENLNRNEISGVLGITPEAVSTALHKGRKKILSQLAVLNRGTN